MRSFAAQAPAVLPRYFDWRGDGFGLEVHARPNIGHARTFSSLLFIALDLAAKSVGLAASAPTTCAGWT